MPFCTKCGQQTSDTSKFCTKCGHPLIKPAPQNPGSVLFAKKEDEARIPQDETEKGQNSEIHTPVITIESDSEPSFPTSRGTFFTTNKKKIIIITSLIGTVGILVLAYFIFIKNGTNTTNDKYLSRSDSSQIPHRIINPSSPLQNESGSGDSLKYSPPIEQLPNNISNDPNQSISDTQPIKSTKGLANSDLKSVNPNTKDVINIGNDDKDPDNFTYLTVSQIKKDLLNKPLCEGLIYTGEDQKLIILGGLPDNIYQKKLDLFGPVTIKIQFKDDTENKGCSVEIFYKKGNNKFNYITYVQK